MNYEHLDITSLLGGSSKNRTTNPKTPYKFLKPIGTDNPPLDSSFTTSGTDYCLDRAYKCTQETANKNAMVGLSRNRGSPPYNTHDYIALGVNFNTPKYLPPDYKWENKDTARSTNGICDKSTNKFVSGFKKVDDHDMDTYCSSASINDPYTKEELVKLVINKDIPEDKISYKNFWTDNSYYTCNKKNQFLTDVSYGTHSNSSGGKWYPNLACNSFKDVGNAVIYYNEAKQKGEEYNTKNCYNNMSTPGCSDLAEYVKKTCSGNKVDARDTIPSNVKDYWLNQRDLLGWRLDGNNTCKNVEFPDTCKSFGLSETCSPVQLQDLQSQCARFNVKDVNDTIKCNKSMMDVFTAACEGVGITNKNICSESTLNEARDAKSSEERSASIALQEKAQAIVETNAQMNQQSNKDLLNVANQLANPTDTSSQSNPPPPPEPDPDNTPMILGATGGSVSYSCCLCILIIGLAVIFLKKKK